MLTGKDQLILVALQIPNDLGTVLSKVQDCANPVFHKRLQPIREKGVKIHCIDRKTLLLLILPKKNISYWFHEKIFHLYHHYLPFQQTKKQSVEVLVASLWKHRISWLLWKAGLHLQDHWGPKQHKIDDEYSNFLHWILLVNWWYLVLYHKRGQKL